MLKYIPQSIVNLYIQDTNQEVSFGVWLHNRLFPNDATTDRTDLRAVASPQSGRPAAHNPLAELQLGESYTDSAIGEPALRKIESQVNRWISQLRVKDFQFERSSKHISGTTDSDIHFSLTWTRVG